MKQLVVVALVGGCWSSSQPAPQSAASDPASAPARTASAKGARPVEIGGGASYGGSTYGVLGSTALLSGGTFAPLTGTGDLAGLTDAELNAALGGSAWGDVHAGGFGDGGLRGQPSPVPTARVGQAAVTGNLDKEVIRRYVRRNLQKLRYCYERELVSNATLAGTVTAELTIGVDGKVTTSTASGVHPNVASCVARVIKGIEFPAPPGGGAVHVKYPFVFAQDGATKSSPTGGGAASGGADTAVPVGGLYGSSAEGTGDLRDAIIDVQLGLPVVRGALDAAAVTREIRGAVSALRACHAGAQTTTLAVDAVVTFTIAATGKVKAASAVGGNAKLEACLARTIRGLAFPKPRAGEVRVSYPLTFSDGQALGGFGFSGTGRGGGGTGYGTIGLGTYGTIGHGSGTGAGYGVGGLRGRKVHPVTRLGAPIIVGGLSSAVIRRSVMRHITKIGYCYERQLLATPTLAGKLTAKFTIEADGKVVLDSVRGLHPDVDACVGRVLAQIAFPKPASGDVVDVTYPVTFAPAP